MLDGVHIGTGGEGLAELKRLIKKMAKGSEIDLIPYYGGGGFPFNGTELSSFAQSHGVVVWYPDL
jgi:hypothetical protein